MKQLTVQQKVIKVVRIIFLLVAMIYLVSIPRVSIEGEMQAVYTQLLKWYLIGLAIFLMVSYFLQKDKAVTIQQKIIEGAGVIWVIIGIILFALFITGVSQSLAFILLYIVSSFCISFLAFCLKLM